MWPFRRRPGPVQSPSAVLRREWPLVPPIQRTVTPIATTFGTASFERNLASRRWPGFVEPLSHQVSAGAPTGVVAGVLTPVPSAPPTTGHLLPGSSGEASRSVQAFSPSPWRLAAAAVDGGGSSAPARSLVQAPAPDTPRFHVPSTSLQRAVESSPPLAEATAEPVESVAEPVESVAEPVESVAEPVEGMAEPVVPGEAAVVVEVPRTTEPRPARHQAEVAQRTSPAGPRRLGLGPPLSHGAPPSPLQRAAEVSAPPVARTPEGGATLTPEPRIAARDMLATSPAPGADPVIQRAPVLRARPPAGPGPATAPRTPAPAPPRNEPSPPTAEWPTGRVDAAGPSPDPPVVVARQAEEAPLVGFEPLPGSPGAVAGPVEITAQGTARSAAEGPRVPESSATTAARPLGSQGGSPAAGRGPEPSEPSAVIRSSSTVQRRRRKAWPDSPGAPVPSETVAGPPPGTHEQPAGSLPRPPSTPSAEPSPGRAPSLLTGVSFQSLLPARPLSLMQRITEGTPADAAPVGARPEGGHARAAAPVAVAERVEPGRSRLSAPATAGMLQRQTHVGLPWAEATAAERGSTQRTAALHPPPFWPQERSRSVPLLGPEGAWGGDAPANALVAGPRRAGPVPARPADPGRPSVTQRAASPAPQPLAGAAHPGEAALATGLATLEPGGDVVFATPPTTPTPSVQRAAEAGPAPAPVPTPAPAPTAEQPTPAAPTNDQLDELAKDLYAKIRDQLKAELRLDRERCGRVTDAR